MLNERALINIVQGKQKIAAAIGNYSILPEILNEIERWERGKVSGNIIDILMNQSKYIKHTYFGMICKNTNEL